MKRNIIWMIIGCAIPLSLIFFAPALGLGTDTSLFVFIVAMFVCHLLMHRHHRKNERHGDNLKTLKSRGHEHH